MWGKERGGNPGTSSEIPANLRQIPVDENADFLAVELFETQVNEANQSWVVNPSMPAK